MENVYIGMRYVPKFSGDWNDTKTYEPLEIVTYQGNSYTSRTYVPTGVAISNDEYWVVTGNYNAQVEAYRQETARVQNDLDKKPFIGRDTIIPTTVSDYGSIIGVSDYTIRKGDLFIQSNTNKIFYIGGMNAQSVITWIELVNQNNLETQLQSLESSIETEISEIQSENKFNSRTGMKIGIFSDSWGKGNNGSGGFFKNNYANLLGEKLGGTVYNYSLGGAGFVRKINNQNMKDYLDSLTNLPDLNVCVVMGGFNDFNHLNDVGSTYTYADIYNSAQAYLVDLMQKFPNAKIIWCGMNMRCKILNTDFWNVYDYINNVPLVVDSDRPIIRCTNWLWPLIGKESYYISENNAYVHPSEAGHRIIANSIMQAFYGGDNNYKLSLMGSNRDSYVFSGAERFSGNFYVQQDNDEITIHFPVIRFENEVTSGTIASAVTVPPLARPFSAMTVPVYSGSNDFELVCTILETGVMYLKRVSGSSIKANANLYIPEIKFKLYSNN